MKNRLKASAVRELAHGKWLGILSALVGDVLGDALAVRLGQHVDCPFHGGKEDFRLDGNTSKYGTAAETGGAICTCKTWRDGFELLKDARGWSFPEALTAVAEYLGMEVDDRGNVKDLAAHRRRIEAQRAQARKREAARRRKQQAASRRATTMIRKIWDEAYPLRDRRTEPLRLYLARRQLSIQQLQGNPDIRFHPRLICFQRSEAGELMNMGRHPAMLALIRDAQGQPTTLHRTYLTPEGGKLPVAKPKKLMSLPAEARLQGGAIRLFPPGKTLGVAEGIETALSVQFATGMPTWACVSAALLAQFSPPPGVENVVIWADRDRSGAGIEAAGNLRNLLQKKGYRVWILQPDLPIPDHAKGVDWADVWETVGFLGFPKRKTVLHG